MAIEKGSIVQVTSGNLGFLGCLVVVTDVTSWGIKGYVAIPDPGRSSVAYVRVSFENFEDTGGHVLIMEADEENEEDLTPKAHVSPGLAKSE